jgi:hypothetical protein
MPHIYPQSFCVQLNLPPRRCHVEILRKILPCKHLLNKPTLHCAGYYFGDTTYSERQKYGINSLKIKQNFFQKNLWTGQF